MKLDEFRSRRPIDIIAKTNPILIIDEPQSVEGKQTKVRLKEFHPLLTLRYSATHKADSIYNMVYRLDAMEAYNKRLVKKISVKGITESGSTATEGYVYLEGINLSKADPTATIEFDFKGTTGIRKKTMKVGIGFNLYDNSGNLDEYKNGFVVKFIDGRDNSVEFLNGMLDERYDTDIFTEPTIKGKLGTNAMNAQRHLYDHIVYDSTNERDFVTDLDTNTDVAVYVKLPDSFYISTPVGRYNTDWAIAFYEGTVKHIYFVEETKGSMRSMQLRQIEESKIHCAREHFKAISNGNVVYDVVDSYAALLDKVMK